MIWQREFLCISFHMSFTENNVHWFSFADCTILDTVTGAISNYAPLIAAVGDQTLPPVVPTIPAQSVIGCYLGTNGLSTKVADNDNGVSLKNANCVNGDPAVPGDMFGQFVSCNGKNLMAAAKAAVDAGKLKPPLPGVGSSGHACYSTISFEMVDQDPSDNIVSTFLFTTPPGAAKPVFAQATQANRAALLAMNPMGIITEQGNPGDEGLITKFLDPAFGCKPWKAPNLADPGQMSGSFALNEIQALSFLKASMAMGATITQFGLIPVNDAMTMPKGAGSAVAKTNAYRAEIGQPPLSPQENDGGKIFCQNFYDITARSIVSDLKILKNNPSPITTDANTLMNFMGQRYAKGYAALGCEQLIGKKVPLEGIPDANNVNTAVKVNDPILAKFAMDAANGIVIPPNSLLPPNPNPATATGSAGATAVGATSIGATSAGGSLASTATPGSSTTFGSGAVPSPTIGALPPVGGPLSGGPANTLIGTAQTSGTARFVGDNQVGNVLYMTYVVPAQTAAPKFL
jgi:hypothetical protein